ncbi:hypothetical protein HK104_001567 [Borealophlyctis nickersoniae]|nr:hypothetical protein HK104_001567 [Borealophlyctis nickersoniae]
MSILQFTEAPDVVIALASNTALGVDDLAVAQVVPGIDVIYSMDASYILTNDVSNPERKGDYPLVTTGPTGKNVLIINDGIMSTPFVTGVGRIDITFENGNPVAWNGSINAVKGCPSNTTVSSTCAIADPVMDATVQTAYQPVSTSQNQVIGNAISMLPGGSPPCRIGECAVGSLLADAILWKMGGLCDAVILNGGNFKTNLPAGNITSASVAAVMPYAGYVAIVGMRGADIWDMFINGVSRVNNGSVAPASLTLRQSKHSHKVSPIKDPAGGTGRFPQVANFRVTYNGLAPRIQRLISLDILDKVSGRYVRVEPDAVYQLCVTDFMRRGGDDYEMLVSKPVNFFDSGPDFGLVMKQYINVSDMQAIMLFVAHA